MAAGGSEGILGYDPSVAGVAGDTSGVSGGGAIVGAGDYYSPQAQLAQGRSDVSEVVRIRGPLAGTMVVEVSNCTDAEIRAGEDDWVVEDSVSIPSIAGATTNRVVDTDPLVFFKGSGNDLAAVAATTTILPACTAAGAGVGKTLTANANGALVVDGVAIALNDLVLVKNQNAKKDNGLYKCTTLGDATHAWVLTRATTLDANAEATPGKAVAVAAGGTVNGSSSWVLAGDDQKFGINLQRTGFARYRLKFSWSSGKGELKSRRLTKGS